MATKISQPQHTATDREFFTTRLLNAPLKLVWKVWTEPEHIAKWWGPNGFTNTIFKMDMQPGGVWEFIMHGPDGTDYKNKNVFDEIIPFQKITFSHVSVPLFKTTITFEEKQDQTLLTFRMVFETAEEKQNAIKVFKADVGLKQNFYKLEGYLKKVSAEKELSITRIIDAPRELVFKVWTDPEHLAKWWGPKGFTNPVCKIDPQPGGKIYIDMKGPDGKLYPMDGVYHEIVEPHRIVFTSAPLDQNGNRLFEVLNTITFTEENGKTKLIMEASVSRITAESAPYLEGMNEGWNQSIDRLNAYAVQLLGK